MELTDELKQKLAHCRTAEEVAGRGFSANNETIRTDSGPGIAPGLFFWVKGILGSSTIPVEPWRGISC